MRYNVQYVDKGGQLITSNVESHDVRAAIREALYQFPDATRIYKCVLAEVDNLESSTGSNPESD
tara:strand:+ start:290 stop:481 length:192 start_codon:yes stop_codon:yes gene_type:complete